MNHSSVLRWASSYGDGTVGEKFAWISSRPANGLGSSHDLLPVELAIPRLASQSGNAPDPDVGNTSPGQTGENGEQQIVVRRSGTTGDHYVLLNGESGSAVENGEGHEQPDQLQLLYYRDDVSYLLDSGYDNASFSVRGVIIDFFDGGGVDQNSTWNHYYDHNVLHYRAGEGGLYNPSIDIFNHRKVSPADRLGEASSLFRTSSGDISVLHGEQELLFVPADYGYQQEILGYYTRDVLVIDDPDEPYLVDFNRVNHGFTAYEGFRKFEMSYHANSNDFANSASYKTSTGGFLEWESIGGAGSRALSIYPMAVEFELTNDPGSGRYDLQMRPDEVQETSSQSIEKLVLRDVGKPYFSVASILQTEAGSQSYSPKTIWAYDEDPGNTRHEQGWVWQQDANTFDVFVARSAGETSPQNLVFNPYLVNAAYPSTWLELPASSDYGFARIEDQGGTVTIDSDYQLNLVSGEAPALHASISGPTCIEDGDDGYFEAAANGGTPPYSYDWYTYLYCGGGAFASRGGPVPLAPTCNTWTYTGSGSTLFFGGYGGEDFSIRATVTDGEDVTDTSNSIYVDVRTISEGPCSQGFSESPSKSESESASDAATEAAESLKRGLPESYSLSANYPNPFSSSTTIDYALPEPGHVTLVVYDITGREVERLVDAFMEAGIYQAKFDANDLSSGVYFYRIVADVFDETQRMTLMK